MCERDEMSKAARAWILILGAGLVAGLVGVVQNGWQQPGDTIGATVWFALALSTALINTPPITEPPVVPVPNGRVPSEIAFTITLAMSQTVQLPITK